MMQLRLKAALVLALVFGTLAGATALRPTARLADTRPAIELKTLFPEAFGGWEIDTRMPAQLVAPDAQAMIDKIYNQTLSRTYVNAQGDRIMLSVAYGGDQSDATRAHRPEVCYPAQGFQVTSGENTKLSLQAHTFRVRQLVARQGSRNEPITYWITVGDRITITGTEQKLAQLSYGSKGLIADGMLVRISNIDADSVRAFRVQESFLTALAASLPNDMRARVFGSPA